MSEEGWTAASACWERSDSHARGGGEVHVSPAVDMWPRQIFGAAGSVIVAVELHMSAPSPREPVWGHWRIGLQEFSAHLQVKALLNLEIGVRRDLEFGRNVSIMRSGARFRGGGLNHRKHGLKCACESLSGLCLCPNVASMNPTPSSPFSLAGKDGRKRGERFNYTRDCWQGRQTRRGRRPWPRSPLASGTTPVPQPVCVIRFHYKAKLAPQRLGRRFARASLGHYPPPSNRYHRPSTCLREFTCFGGAGGGAAPGEPRSTSRRLRQHAP
jgi:hypothetical protein